MNFKQRITSAAAVAACLLIPHAAAMAAVENYRVTGNYSDGGSNSGTFVLDFGIDAAATPTCGLGCFYTTFEYQSLSISFTGGGATFTPIPADSVYYQNTNAYFDGLTANGIELGLINNATNGSMWLPFLGVFTDRMVFKAADAPWISTPDTMNGGYLLDDNGTMFGFSGVSNITLLTTPVPEPESYALMLAGLGVLGTVARRKRRG